MPKPPRICTACGRVHHVDMHCDRQREQQRIRKARHDRVRPSATARGYDAEWRRLSKLFLSRSENAYCECGAPSTLVRHRISIRRRPDLRLDCKNWLPGCARCNARDHAREEKKGGQTPKRLTSEPLPVPTDHVDRRDDLHHQFDRRERQDHSFKHFSLRYSGAKPRPPLVPTIQRHSRQPTSDCFHNIAGRYFVRESAGGMWAATTVMSTERLAGSRHVA